MEEVLLNKSGSGKEVEGVVREKVWAVGVS
jgi:hypothetical protein